MLAAGAAGVTSVRHSQFLPAPTNPLLDTVEPLSQDGGTRGKCIQERAENARWRQEEVTRESEKQQREH